MWERADSRLPPVKFLVSRLVIEIILVTAINIPLLNIFIFKGDYELNRGGFFCTDRTLRYPLKEDTISTRQCFVIWAAIAVPSIVVVEVLYYLKYPFEKKGLRYRPVGFFPWIVLEIYRIFGYFTLGIIITMLTTEFFKHKMGSLRPNFFTACNPQFSVDGCMSEGHEVFVTDYECHPDADERDARESMKSFLSGHSSASTYVATFIFIYLNLRLTRKPQGIEKTNNIVVTVLFRIFKVLRPFLQFGIIILALYMIITRLTDFKHHPKDVIAGGLLGAVYGFIIVTQIIELQRKPKIFLGSDENFGRKNTDRLRKYRHSPISQIPINLHQVSYEK